MLRRGGKFYYIATFPPVENWGEMAMFNDIVIFRGEKWLYSQFSGGNYYRTPVLTGIPGFFLHQLNCPQDITEILLKVALNTKTLIPPHQKPVFGMSTRRDSTMNYFFYFNKIKLSKNTACHRPLNNINESTKETIHRYKYI
jgi:hypothetical protein